MTSHNTGLRRRNNRHRAILPGILFILFCISMTGTALSLMAAVHSFSRVFGEPGKNVSTVQAWYIGVKLFLVQDELLKAAGQADKPVLFEIKSGEPVDSITRRLKETGLIQNAEAFRLYLVYSGLDTRIRAGAYRITPRLTALEIGRMFQDASALTRAFTILPGWRSEEIAAQLPLAGLNITPEDFLGEVRRPTEMVIPASLTGIRSLEGFLFPGAYDFDRSTTLRQMTTAFLEAFVTQVTTDIRKGYQQNGLDLAQAVTLASIVQRESRDYEDQRLIASVFYNRIQQGMPLQSDPTVQFARGYNTTLQTWWSNPLVWTDFNTASPYNTYLVKGLPPGPISSPGLSALKAVAFPAQSSFLFFVARCDASGLHHFSVDYASHLEKICP